MIKQPRNTISIAMYTCLMGLLVSACDAGPAGEGRAGSNTALKIPIEEIYQSQQCNVTDKDLQVITSPQALTQLQPAQLNLGAEPAEPASGAEPTTNTVVFADNYVVLISQGQQTSAGYSVELTSRNAEVKNGSVRLPVEFSQPPEDAFTAQVMTAPCLVVAFPRQFDGQQMTSVAAGPMKAELTNSAD